MRNGFVEGNYAFFDKYNVKNCSFVYFFYPVLKFIKFFITFVLQTINIQSCNLHKDFNFMQHTSRVTAIFIFLSLTLIAFIGCKEEIDQSNRYTFTGETIASYLTKNSEKYSHFIKILKQAKKFQLLTTYGRYTCFVPTNAAIESFLYEQDSIRIASAAAGKPIRTGIFSPNLDELSDSMANVIAQSHLVDFPYYVADMNEGVLDVKNYNDRYLGVSFVVVNDRFRVLINSQGGIIESDIKAENGVLQVVDHVLSPSANFVGAQIGKFPYLSIFHEALAMTGMEDSMMLYKDESYKLANIPVDDYERQGGTANYPATKYYKYTAFVETDETFAQYGINNINDLIEKAREWYGTDDENNYSSRNNALNKFVSYHLLDREVPYNRLVAYNLKWNNYNSEENYVKTADRYEYFETMMPNTLCKTIKPLSDPDNAKFIILNQSHRLTPSVGFMRDHLNIHVLSVTDFIKMDEKYKNFDPNALNGMIHIIDKVMVYNEDEMAGNVMNERMRFDLASIMPELVNNGVKFCPWGSAGKNCSNHMEVAIPIGYSKYYKAFSNTSALHYLCAYTGWADYQGDEFICIGSYDIAYKLPPVPPGTYEIRLAYTATSNRGVTQFYVDNVVTGIPVDLRRYAYQPEIGWIADSQTDDNGIQNDKTMRNHGYMKGPSIYYYGGPHLLSRDYNGCIRRIVTTKYLGKGEHWIRFKNVQADDDGTAEFMHDYLEIVPMTVIRSTMGEDRK